MSVARQGASAGRAGSTRSAGRSQEVLGVNIEDLDLAGRRCQVKAKGARTKARRRGQVREDFVLESLYWDVGTALLLPRLLKGRTRGPVFVTHRRPGPGPSSEAIAELTSLLAPGDSGRHRYLGLASDLAGQLVDGR